MPILDSISSEWVELIVGSLIGAFASVVITKFPGFVKGVKNRLSKDSRAGKYYSYNYSTKNNGTINTDEWIIKNSFDGKLRIRVKNQSGKNLQYSGDVIEKGDKLYFRFNGLNHNEAMLYVFHSPVDQKLTKETGVFSAISMDNEPIAGKALLSSVPLDDTDIREILGKQEFIVVTRK